MTVDSIPISELGQRGAGFLAAHDWGKFSINAYAAIEPSPPAKFSSFAFIFSESYLREISFSACTSGFATHVEARSPPLYTLIITHLYTEQNFMLGVGTDATLT
ncbi:hypothetical protein Lmac_3127 [Legionella maceachernii]|uniref:Uncharacterized protein n=1 Tax=Legionella maceachernii TaxID=466 RepID=A0A0W0VW89_9GAMM|nr:hypothetical protein Lmac_3127 [Legionella maceachernii]